MNEYRQGSAPVGRAVSKARAGRCWASRTDEPAYKQTTEHTTMKKYIATLVAVVYAVPAHAVPVTIYGSTVKYANEVSKYYDETPPTFRNKMGSVIVITFDNIPTLTTLYTAWGLMDARDATQYRRRKPCRPRQIHVRHPQGLPCNDPTARSVNSEKVRRVVVHEMAHLYDFSNGGISAGPNGAISKSASSKRRLMPTSKLHLPYGSAAVSKTAMRWTITPITWKRQRKRLPRQ